MAISPINIAVWTLSGALAIACVRRWKALTTLMSGSVMLLFGVAAILAGANAGSGALLITGSLVTGLGFGCGFLGALRTLIPLISAGERAALMAAFYVECYLANNLPAIAADFGVQRWGLLTTVNLYALTIMMLTVIALLASWLTRGKLAAPSSAASAMACK
ncbi:hypothetical protein [Sodalis glossinidius]|uniref:hypothetical protein n=1 Tax=Sodalis glossinidius TaxID=63612 RepID=UPI0002FD8512|nr:hypothetical protein [Sodalis glossinidius]